MDIFSGLSSKVRSMISPSKQTEAAAPAGANTRSNSVSEVFLRNHGAWKSPTPVFPGDRSCVSAVSCASQHAMRLSTGGREDAASRVPFSPCLSRPASIVLVVYRPRLLL